MERKFRIFSLVSFFFSLAATAALAASPAEWDVAGTPRTRESVEWIQGDTVERSYRFSDEGEPLDLAAFDSVVWSVVSITNMAEQWAGTTGTVSTAETAVVSFRLTQEESALPVGNYWGFVRGLAGPPATPRQTTLVQQGIRVRPGPDPDAIDVVRPTLLSAQVASNAAAIAELQVQVATNAANISSNAQELIWQAISLSGHEGRILGNERAIADLQAGTNTYATTGRVAAAEAAIAANAAAIAELEAAAGDCATHDEVASAVAPLATKEALAGLAEEVAAHPTNSFGLSAAMQEQVCKMDIFEVAMTPRLSDVGTTNETVSAEKSILARKVETTEWAGYLLTPDIQASKSDTNVVAYRALWNGTAYTNAAGEAFFRVDGGGAFGNLYATFGEASRLYLDIPRLTNDVVRTNYLYAGDTPGSLRAGCNAMTNALNAAGSRGWTPGGGNFLFGTNWDFSCVGHGDTPGHPFQATLITPRHAIVAGHCAPPIGTQFRWDGASLGYRTALVEKRRSLKGDKCVVLLDDYVDAPPALLLDGPRAASANLTLPEAAGGVPGLYVAAFHKGASAAVSRVTADLGRDASLEYLPATNALPAEIAGIDYVGGDSSSPVFLLPPDSERPVLLSCAWYTLGAGNGGGGPNWASEESWTFLMRAMDEMDAEMGQPTPRPARYDLNPWPAYNAPPTPQ